MLQPETIERRARNPAVTADRELASISDQAAGHGFVPVVDATGRLVGVVDRRRLVDPDLPSAA